MATYERVLVPTDGSEGVATTTEHALSIAADDATIHALYVVDKKLLYAAGEDGEELDEDLKAEGEDAVAAVAARAEDAGFKTETDVRVGVPPREILAYADEENIDAIAMGTRGRTGTERVVNLGSTTQRVIENASVPVLAVAVD